MTYKETTTRNTIMFYKVTLTARAGLTEGQVESIGKHFSPCTHAYLVHEYGADGSNSHIEGVIELDAKKTSNVTRSIKTLYDKLDIEVVPFITIKVKAVTHLGGAISYAMKELQDEGKVILLRGWKDTWIQKQFKEQVKKQSSAPLLKMGTWVTKRMGPAIIFEFCRAENLRIRSLADYREVIIKMGDKQYMFDKGIHVCCYANVLALMGDGSGHRQVMDQEFRFMED